MKNIKAALILLALLACCVPATIGQVVGLSAELDTLFQEVDSSDPLAGLSTYGAYNVYANFTDSADVLSSLYADVIALGTPAMGIDAPCGCENSLAESSVIDAAINPAFFGVFPLLQYQTFWTVGLTAYAGPTGSPSSIGVVGPEDVCSGFNITDGAIFVAGSEGNWLSNAVAGDDLKVLIARVVTCGDFELSACVQAFVGGIQGNVQQWCPDEPLFVQHVVLGCNDEAACNYDELATQNDGSCIFANTTCDDMNELTVGDTYQDDCDCKGFSCYDPFACNFSTAGLQDDDLCFYVADYEIVGSTDPFSSTLQTYTYTETPGSIYEWTVEGGSVTDGDGTSTLDVVWTEEGNGSICVVETTADGCVGSEVCLDVTVRLSSVQELPQGELEIYPNPARDWLQLQWTGPVLNNACIVLRDASGRVVFNQNVAERKSLDVSSFGAGAYVLEFAVPEFGSIQRQVVIQ